MVNICGSIFYCALYLIYFFFFFFNDTATTEIYTLSLHDALPIASSPEVQPVEIRATGPSAPQACATSTAMVLGTIWPYRCGVAYSWSTSQLRPPSERTTYSSSRLIVQPTAQPMLTPVRSTGNASGPSPLSVIASRAHTTANCEARSMRRISCGRSPSLAGSKSTSAAILDRNPVGSNKVIVRVAVRPSVSRSQNCLTPIPPGATTPIPVMTARLPVWLTAPLQPVARARPGPVAARCRHVRAPGAAPAVPGGTPRTPARCRCSPAGAAARSGP